MAEFADDFEEVSDEEKLQIAQHFLLSSPPGQFQDVLSDVRKLLPEGLLTESLATGIARAYNIKTGKVVSTPAGVKTVVCAEGEVDLTHYIDPIKNATFGIDHLSLQTSYTGGAPDSADTALESTREQLQTAVSAYIANTYQTEDSAGAVFAREVVLYICLTGEKPNLKNFWSGKWSSAWRLDTVAQTISGDIKVHAHYFEDGNVQLQSSKPFVATTLSYSSDAELVTAVISHIQTSEASLHAGLEEMYSTMNEETFKSMRRLMPVTRSKMEWNINSVRMVKQTRK